jgi:uncharacterized protein (DUF427 family)
VHHAGRPPTYAFPEDDVAGVPTTPEGVAPGYVTVPWHAVDAWFEEEEQVYGHPRNPYHRVDCLRSRRPLRVEAIGIALVDTADTVAVYETALEPRLYVAPHHVRMDLLTRSTLQTYCPYKGTATYWSYRLGDTALEDIAWSYEDPLPESAPLRQLLSFEETRVAVHHDFPPSG